MEAKGYRDGCAKCADAAREVAALKAHRCPPTLLVTLHEGDAAVGAALALIASLILGACWVVAGSAPWVQRLAVVTAAWDALMIAATWSTLRSVRYLNEREERLRG